MSHLSQRHRKIYKLHCALRELQNSHLFLLLQKTFFHSRQHLKMKVLVKVSLV